MPGSDGQSLTYAVPAPADRSRLAIVPLLLWMEMAACVILAGLLLWKGILPGWRFLNTDFPNYYLVARLLREGYSLDRIYDWIWLQRIKDHWGLSQPLVGFAGLTPFSALPIVPLSIFSALAAKRLWIIASLLFLGSSVEILHRVTSLGRRRVWLLALMAVFPLRTSFLLGQMHLFVLFLLVLAYYFHRNGKQVACGACLSIAGALKIYPLLFGFYFLWKQQWRSAFAMVGAALLLAGIGYLWIGSDVLSVYAVQILPRSLQGEVLDPYSAQTASVAALFHRLWIAEPTLNPVPWRNSPSLYAIFYPLWQLAVFVPLLALGRSQAKSAGAQQLEWAAYVFALLLLSPVPASYHFVAAIFSIVLLVDLLLAWKEYSIAVLAVLLYCMISLVELFSHAQGRTNTLLALGRLWVELLVWALFLFCLWRNREHPKTRPLGSPRTVSAFVLCVAIWTASMIGYHRHFAYLEQDIARRMPVTAPSYLASGFRRTPGGYVFTAMSSDGYRVLDQAGKEVWKGPGDQAPVDQLSVSVAQYAPVAAVEFADSSGSRIAIVSSTAASEGPQDVGPSIANAESPAISSDGSVVAFIRESKGRGTLWLARLEQPLGRLRAEPTQIVDDAYDIRDADFAPSGWIMFSARLHGRISIFSLNPGALPRMFLSDNGGDSPTVSPDERFVAFRKLVHNRWQLGYVNLATGRERMLTFGDCNAYRPAWSGPLTIAYATDCGRGLGLSALASVNIDPRQ
jgi:hypothetical protein